MAEVKEEAIPQDRALRTEDAFERFTAHEELQKGLEQERIQRARKGDISGPLATTSLLGVPPKSGEWRVTVEARQKNIVKAGTKTMGSTKMGASKMGPMGSSDDAAENTNVVKGPQQTKLLSGSKLLSGCLMKSSVLTHVFRPPGHTYTVAVKDKAKAPPPIKPESINLLKDLLIDPDQTARPHRRRSQEVTALSLPTCDARI
eukprot:2798965-Rhodomonas_salina.1